MYRASMRAGLYAGAARGVANRAARGAPRVGRTRGRALQMPYIKPSRWNQNASTSTTMSTTAVNGTPMRMASLAE